MKYREDMKQLETKRNEIRHTYSTKWSIAWEKFTTIKKKLYDAWKKLAEQKKDLDALKPSNSKKINLKDYQDRMKLLESRRNDALSSYHSEWKHAWDNFTKAQGQLYNQWKILDDQRRSLESQKTSVNNSLKKNRKTRRKQAYYVILYYNKPRNIDTLW